MHPDSSAFESCDPQKAEESWCTQASSALELYEPQKAKGSSAFELYEPQKAEEPWCTKALI